jgi:hypothetical protein
MAITNKKLSDRDAAQTNQLSFNDVNATMGVDGFIVGLKGRKITRTDGGTFEEYSFYEGATLLYTIKITYTDITKSNLLEVERTE